MFKGSRPAKAVLEHFVKVHNNTTILTMLFFLRKNNVYTLSFQQADLRLYNEQQHTHIH